MAFSSVDPVRPCEAQFSTAVSPYKIKDVEEVIEYSRWISVFPKPLHAKRALEDTILIPSLLASLLFWRELHHRAKAHAVIWIGEYLPLQGSSTPLAP